MTETTQEEIEQERDNHAVDQFAAAMKEKLASARHKGRGGWHDPDRCSASFLADLLIGHLSKGNDGTFLDVANFCMMLHQRGESPEVLQYADRLAAIEERVREVAVKLDRAAAKYREEGLEGQAGLWDIAADRVRGTLGTNPAPAGDDGMLPLPGWRAQRDD